MTRKNVTVGDLIMFLQEQDQDMPVWLSKDEEGNGFAPLPKEEFMTIGKVIPQKWGWSDDLFMLTEDTPEGADTEVVLILWPDA